MKIRSGVSGKETRASADSFAASPIALAVRSFEGRGTVRGLKASHRIGPLPEALCLLGLGALFVEIHFDVVHLFFFIVSFFHHFLGVGDDLGFETNLDAGVEFEDRFHQLLSL